MRPTDLPADLAVALAQEAGRRRAKALRVYQLLQHAVVGHLSEDQAVAHGVRILRGPRRTVPVVPAVPAREPAVPAQRRS